MDQQQLIDSKYDNLFKLIVIAEWCVKSDGNVESDPGYFSLTEIPSLPAERDQMWDAVIEEPNEFDEDDLDKLPAGWYITIQLNSGLIFVYSVASKVIAEREYAELEQVYTNWCGTDDDEGQDESNH